MIRQVVPVDASWKRVNDDVAILLASPCHALGAKEEQLHTSAKRSCVRELLLKRGRDNAYHLDESCLVARQSGGCLVSQELSSQAARTVRMHLRSIC